VYNAFTIMYGRKGDGKQEPKWLVVLSVCC